MSTTATVFPAGTWNFDAVHSTAGFAVRHMVVSTFRGAFDEVTATIEGDALSGAVKVDSLRIKDENLAAHLKSGDFFDSATYPEISFSSSDITRDGDAIELRGSLTVKDNTRELVAKGSISGPTDDPFGGTRLGLTFETVVDRTEFGLNWNADLPKGGKALGNDVTLTVELEFALEA